MDKKLKATLDLLNKRGNVITASSKKTNVIKAPSGNLLIDIATKGGFPQGRIIRVLGEPSAGKTQFCLKFFANNQTRCHNCWSEKDKCKCGNYEPFKLLFVDLENSYDPEWAERNGIIISDPENPNVLVSKPSSGEEAVDIIDAVIRKRLVSVIILDSIAAMAPSIELEKAVQESVGGQVGIGARIVNAAMRKWINALSSHEEGTLPPLIIGINQIRLTTNQYAPETTPFGKGQHFASSLDIRLDRKKYLTVKGKQVTLGDKNEDHGQRVAQLVQFHISKNKIATSGASGEFYFWQEDDPDNGKKVGDYDYGPSLLEYGIRYQVIQKIKSEFTIISTGEVLGTNKEVVEELLKTNRQISNYVANEITEKVRSA